MKVTKEVIRKVEVRCCDFCGAEIDIGDYMNGDAPYPAMGEYDICSDCHAQWDEFTARVLLVAQKAYETGGVSYLPHLTKKLVEFFEKC